MTWFSGKGVAAAARVAQVVVPEYGARYAAPAAHAAPRDTLTALPVQVANLGTRTWATSEVFLAHHVYRDGALVAWDGVRTALPSAVGPDQTVTVSALVRTPATPGVYEVRFDLVHEGVTWFSSRGTAPAPLSLTVQ